MIDFSRTLLRNDVLMQLFVNGPTLDGDLISKSDRDLLVIWKLCDRWEGWNFLTPLGVQAGYAGGLIAREYGDQRWYLKASGQPRGEVK